MLQASVIVATYHRPQFLLDAVRSIAMQYIEGQFEIVVVDNAPSNELRSQVVDLSTKAGGTPVIKYSAEPRTGLHFARHAGARTAVAEILVYCDDDILATGGWLRSILAPFSNPSVVCVGGRVFPRWEMHPPSWIASVPQGYYSLLDYGDDEHVMKLDETFNGCNFAIRKRVLLELGGFNPDGYGDRRLIWQRGDGEVGLMRKIRAKGYQAVYAPGAAIEHRIPPERLKEEYLLRRAHDSGIEASYTFYRYDRPSLLALVLRAVRLMSGYVALYLLGRMNRNHEGERLRYRLKQEKYRGNFLHTIRLLTQADLRQFCQRDNYLEDPC